MTAEWTSRSAFDPTHPTALAVYCSDGRFTDVVEELLHSLGHARLDTLTIPGGAALFNRHAALYSDYDTVLRGAELLIRTHSIRKVILLAHAACGYYRASYALDDATRARERQVADLDHARSAILAVHPQLEIEGYYATPRGGRVVIERVPLGPDRA